MEFEVVIGIVGAMVGAGSTLWASLRQRRARREVTADAHAMADTLGAYREQLNLSPQEALRIGTLEVSRGDLVSHAPKHAAKA